MFPTTRRQFLRDATLGATAATLLSPAASRAAGEAERVRIGVIGCGNQGTGHLRSLATLQDAVVASACDVDEARLAASAKLAGSAKPVGDFRRILDDPSIDAVTIATPDHWHTPVALLALAAGKHVYVEKPCCHNVREGQLLRRGDAEIGQGVCRMARKRAPTRR